MEEEFVDRKDLESYGFGKSFLATRSSDKKPVFLRSFSKFEFDSAKIDEQRSLLQKLQLDVFVEYLDVVVDSQIGESVVVINTADGLAPLSTYIEKLKAEKNYLRETKIVSILMSISDNLERLRARMNLELADQRIDDSSLLEQLDPSRVFYNGDTGEVRLDVLHYHTENSARNIPRYRSPEAINQCQVTACACSDSFFTRTRN